MKKGKILLLLIFCTSQWLRLTAQFPPAGSYTTDTTMGRFHGTWQWAAGTDTVRLVLKTKKVYYPISGGYYVDRLVGWHIYKQGSTVIESSIQYVNDVDSSTFLGGSFPDTPDKIDNGGFRDITKKKDVELFLTLNAAQNQLTWRLAPTEWPIYGPGQTAPPPGFTLPRNLVLTKL